VVSIVDHGIGMKPPRLAEENQRLVERERLDVAPTSVLGLFVVGRLARRHSLGVTLIPTNGGGITARVLVPPTLFNRPMPPAPPEVPAAPTATPAPAVQQGRLPIPELPSIAIPPARHTAGFSWFPNWQSGSLPVVDEQTVFTRPVAKPVTKPAAEPVNVKSPAPHTAGQLNGRLTPGDGESRSGLRRRVAGAQMPGAAVVPAETPKAPVAPPLRKVQHDPVAARDALDGFQTAFAQAAATPEVTPPPPPPPAPAAALPEPAPAPAAPIVAERAGLTRRIPGANLAPGLRSRAVTETPARGMKAQPKRLRDPEAERASFDAFSSGLARAVDTDPDLKESTR
jgi:hypothetical protein